MSGANDELDAVREGTDAAGPELKVFINYRRGDSAGDARALYDRLSTRFGGENVFLDVQSLHAGGKWLDDIRHHGGQAAVFLALIGPQWASIMAERARGRVVDPEEDYVRLEIEAALRRGSGVKVVPVLIDDAQIPTGPMLPGPLRPLAARQAIQLRHARWDDDVDHLIASLERIAAEPAEPEAPEAPAPPAAPAPPPPPPVVVNEPAPVAPAAAAAPRDLAAPPPDDRHYDEVVSWIAEEGAVVPFLGSGANASDRAHAWEEGCGHLPDAQELARELSVHLTRRFQITSEPTDLAQVSQYLSVTSGPADLHRALKRILTADCPPTTVHKFLAGVPGRLQGLGLEERYQLIVTTNYDDALERAFDAEEEPYDLVVYLATGPNRGRFQHVPFDGQPELISVPNEYEHLPIGDDLELQRTTIVKIHGAVEGSNRRYPWRENYVITEDDYIDYLSQSRIEDLVPFQILEKLRYSHYLFLGYTMRDWNLRVFLQRLWGDQKLGAKSWAIEPAPDILEKEFWSEFGVDLYASPLVGYVNKLSEHLALLAQGAA